MIFLFAMALETAAQQGVPFSKNFSISIGATHYRFIDEAFSHHRTQYQGTAFAIDLRYQKIKEKYFFNIDLQGNSGIVSAPLQNLEGRLVYIQLAGSYARFAKAYNLAGIPSAFYAGGQLRSANYIMEDLDVLEEVSTTFNQTLDLFLLQRMSLSKRHALEVTAAFPMAGLVKRTRYDGGANQNLEGAYRDNAFAVVFSGAKFSVINPLGMPQLHVVYVRHLTRRTDFSLRYQFNYLKNNSRDTINLYNNGITAGLRFNF